MKKSINDELSSKDETKEDKDEEETQISIQVQKDYQTIQDEDGREKQEYEILTLDQTYKKVGQIGKICTHIYRKILNIRTHDELYFLHI